MRALVALLAIAACDCTPSRIGPASPTAARERSMALALTVTCLGETGFSKVQGSGVAVSSRHALTARHVIDCNGATPWQIQATDSRGRSFEMLVDKLRADDADAARLVAAGTAEPFDLFARPGPAPSNDDVVCMSTGIPDWVRACGAVARVGKDMFQFWHPADFGNSGSGVYDARGRLVGIVVQLRRCSNGQHCRTVAEGRFRDLLEGLPVSATLELAGK